MPKLIENARELIMTEGKRLLLEKSYNELNIREIAKNCEIGTGTFYNYFKTKDELVSAIFIEDWSKAIEIIDRLYEDPMPLKEKFRTIYTCMVEFLDRYITIFYEISTATNTKGCPEDKNGFGMLYMKAQEIIECSQHSLNSDLTSQELSTLIMSNLIYLCKTRFTTFDKLYDSLVI